MKPIVTGRSIAPSPPLGAERVGVRWGIPECAARPTSPSHRSAMGPSLSPLKGGEGPSSFFDRDTRSPMTEISHRFIETNGIRLHVAELGSGPLVVMCHGFPESWYSWRHQLRALANAGFHAVAPDMRGYGRTEAPAAIDQYTLLHLVGDMVGLVDAMGGEPAVIAGHDWGAPVAWHAALLRPDKFRGVIALSVPFR